MFVTFEFGQIFFVAVQGGIQTGHFSWIVRVKAQPVLVIGLSRHDRFSFLFFSSFSLSFLSPK